MATTKRRTTARTTTKRKSPTKVNQSIAARTGRTIKQQPYVSAAIATGAVTAVAAAVAGAFFFRKSDKTLAEIGDDLSDKFKGGYDDAREAVTKGARKVKEKTAFFFDDDDSDDERTQSEIAEEALTLKETGKTASRPFDKTSADEIKTGAIGY
jgi:hypothetical protein